MLHKKEKEDEGEFQVIPDTLTSTVWRNLISTLRSHPTILFHDDLHLLRDLFWDLGAVHEAKCKDVIIPLEHPNEPFHSLRPVIPSPLSPVQLIFGKIRDCEMNETGIRIRDFSLTETVKKGIEDLVEFVRIFPEGVLQDSFGFLYDFFIRFGVKPSTFDEAILHVAANRAKAARRRARKELAIVSGDNEPVDYASSDEEVKQESDSSDSSVNIKEKKKEISSDEDSKSSDDDSDAEASSVVTSSEDEDIYCPSSEKSGIPRIPRAYRPWSLRKKDESNRRNGEVREERRRRAKTNVSYKLRRSAAASAKARQVKVKVKPMKPAAPPPPVKAPKSFTFTYRLVPDHFKNCPILNCNSTFTTVDKAERHFRYNHPEEPLPPEIDDGQRFPCSYCTQDFKRERYLEFHILQKHGNPMPSEEVKAVEGPSPPIVRELPKEPEYITVDRFPCPHCTFMSPRSKAMRAHFTREHPKETLCMASIKMVKILRKRNLNFHDPPLEFPCPGCHNSYSLKTVCQRHFIRTHGGVARIVSVRAAATNPAIKLDAPIPVEQIASSTTVEEASVTTVVKEMAVDTNTKQATAASTVVNEDSSATVGKKVTIATVVKEVMSSPVANEKSTQRTFRCTHCDKLFTRRDSLARHFARVHPPKVLIEDKIPLGKKPTPLPIKSFTCPICNLSSTLLYNRQALLVHFKNFHPNVDSSILSGRLDTQPDLAQETQAPLPVDPVIEAPILQAAPVVQEEDISTVTSTNAFPGLRRACSICSRILSDRGSLLRHIRRHHPEADLDALGFHKRSIPRESNSDSGLKPSPIAMPKLSAKPEVGDVMRKAAAKIEPRPMPRLSAKPDLPLLKPRTFLEQPLKPNLRVYPKLKQISEAETTKSDLSATPSESQQNTAAKEQVSRPNLRVKPKPKQIFEPDTSTNRRKSKETYNILPQLHDKETPNVVRLKDCYPCPYCKRLFVAPKAIRIHCRHIHPGEPAPQDINRISESELPSISNVEVEHEGIKPNQLLNGCISTHENEVIPSKLLNGNEDHLQILQSSFTDFIETITIPDEPPPPPTFEVDVETEVINIPVPDNPPTLQVEVKSNEEASIATKNSSEFDHLQPETSKELPNSEKQSHDHDILGIPSVFDTPQAQNTTNEIQAQLEMTSPPEPKNPVKSAKLKAIDLLSPKEKEKLGKAIQSRLEKFISQKGVLLTPSSESKPEPKMAKNFNQSGTQNKFNVISADEAPTQSMAPEEEDETEMHIVQIMEEMTTQVSESVDGETSGGLVPLDIQAIAPQLPEQLAKVSPGLPDISSELHEILDLDGELPELHELESELPELGDASTEVPFSIGHHTELPDTLETPANLSEIDSQTPEIVILDSDSDIEIEPIHSRATETVKSQSKLESNAATGTHSTEISSSSVPLAEEPSLSSNKPSVSDHQLCISKLGLNAPELQVQLVDCVKYPKSVELIKKPKVLPTRRIGPKIKFTGPMKNGKGVKGSPSPAVTQRLNSVQPQPQPKPKKIREPEPSFSSTSEDEDEEYFHEEPDLVTSDDEDYVPPVSTSSKRKLPKSKILISSSESEDSDFVPEKIRKFEKAAVSTIKTPARRMSVDSSRTSNSGKVSVPSHKRRLSDSNHNSAHVIKSKMKQSGK